MAGALAMDSVHSFQRFISVLRQVKRCLIARWSLQKYLAGSVETRVRSAEAVDAPKQRVDLLVEVKRADEATRCPKFWATVSLLHALQSVLAVIEAFVCGFPCHRSYLIDVENTRFKRFFVYQRLSVGLSVRRSPQWPLGEGHCLDDRRTKIGGVRARAG